MKLSELFVRVQALMTTKSNNKNSINQYKRLYILFFVQQNIKLEFYIQRLVKSMQERYGKMREQSKILLLSTSTIKEKLESIDRFLLNPFPNIMTIYRWFLDSNHIKPTKLKKSKLNNQNQFPCGQVHRSRLAVGYATHVLPSEMRLRWQPTFAGLSKHMILT